MLLHGKFARNLKKAPSRSREPVGSPGGLQTSEFDLQELDLRVHAQFVLLQTEYVRVESRAAGRVLGQEQFADSGFGPGLLVLEFINLAFEIVNLS
jgi:hypothetical protein